MTSSKSLQSLQALARDADRENQWELALQHWNELLENFPLHLPGYVGKVNGLIELDRLNEAERTAQKIRDKFPGRPQGLNGLVRIAIKRKQWEQVLSLSAVLVERFPTQAQSYQWRGLAYIELNQFEQAEAIFARLAEQNADKVQGFRGLARVSLKSQRWQQTVDRCNVLIEKFPDQMQGYRWKGKALTALGRFEETEAYYQRLVKQPSTTLIGWQGLAQMMMAKREWSLAIEYWDRLLITEGLDKLPSYLGKSNALKQLSEVDQAINVCKQALHEYPDCARIYEMMGNVYASLTCERQTALLYYQRGLEKNPDDHGLHLKVANSLSNRGELKAAIDILENAIQIAPNLPAAYKALATTQYRIGEVPKALQTLKLCVQINPDSSSAYKNLARFQWKHLKDASSAWRNLVAARERNNAYIPALSEQADLLVDIGRFEAARQLLSTIVQQFSYSAEGYIGLARIEYRNQKYEQAMSAWENIGQQFPQLMLKATEEQARCLIKLNRLDEAETIYKRLCKQFPSKSEGLVGLALVAEQQFQWANACKRWEQVEQQFPNQLLAYHHHIDILIELGEYDSANTLLESLLDALPTACLLYIKLHTKKGQIESALSYCQPAIDKGLAARAATPMTVLALRLGEQKYLENALSLFSARRLPWCSQNVFTSLYRTLGRLQSGEIQQAWTEYLTIFRNEYEYGVKASSTIQANPLAFVLLIIEFAKKTTRQRNSDQFQKILNHISDNQAVFESQSDLLAYVHFLYGLALEAKENSSLALKHARRSLSINPENIHCLSLIDRMLKRQSETSAVIETSTTRDRIALMITTCQKYADKIPLLENSFYKEMDLPHYYVIGNPTLESEWKLDGCILYVKAPDSYELLSIKVVKALEFFYYCTGYKGVIKIDDDCWINSTQAFRSVIERLEDNCNTDYMGRILGTFIGRTWHFGKCQSSKLNATPYALTNESHYCAGGAGYYLSRRSFKLLFEHFYKYPAVFENEPLEDVLIGKILSYYKIKPQPFDLVKAGLIEIDYDIRIRSLDIQEVHRRAVHYIEAKRLEEAAALYSKILRIDEDQPLHYYIELVRLYRALKNEASEAVVSMLMHKRFPDCDLDSILDVADTIHQHSKNSDAVRDNNAPNRLVDT